MLTKTPLCEARTHGYKTYRIPGVLATAAGEVLVTAEARRGDGGDWDANDLVVRRSVDAGATWSPLAPLHEQRDYGEGPLSNCVMIADGEVIHLLFCHNYARCFYQRSLDGGATFTAPREITGAFEPFRAEYAWRVLATGPGHGLRLQSGRLVVPVWLSTGAGGEFGAGKLGHRPSVTTTIVSDDQGETWQRGDLVVQTAPPFVHPSEAVAVELSDGRVLLNVRTESPEHRRVLAVSPDGAREWTAPAFCDALLEPVCMAGSIGFQPPGERPTGHLLFSNPDTLEREFSTWPGICDRKQLTIKLSVDDGATWPISRVLEPGPAGYSDLAVLPDGSALCFYECGLVERMGDDRYLMLARFDDAWLRTGAA